MRQASRRRRTIVIILLALGAVLSVGGFALWALYRVSPTLFPEWFNKLFVILAGLGGLITVGAALSDILLPLWSLLKGDDRPHPWRLADRAPIRRVSYDSLVARLGRSGSIPWIDRGVISSSLLLGHGRIAIVGPMKSGKTREAIELIRMAQEDGWVSVAYEPTSALDLIDQDALAEAVTGQVEPQRCLFFVDELGLRQDSEHLERLSVCIQSICKVRPDTYFLITIQQERLSPRVRKWLKEHQFYHVTPPALTSTQRRELVETGREILEVAIAEQAVTTLAENTDIAKPWDIVSVLQYAPPRNSDCEPLSEEDVQTLLARSEQDIWAEQRREVIQAEPASEPLLRSIVTFVSAGVTPSESSVRRYASYLMRSDVPRRERNRLLNNATERWRKYDIVASGGLYTIPEPRLMPLIIDTEEARAHLRSFVETYNPGLWVSLVLTAIRPVDAILGRLRLLPLSRFRLVSNLRSRLMLVIERLYSWNITSRLATWLYRLLWRLATGITRSLFSWPADQAMLLQELGSRPTRAAYISSSALVWKGVNAYSRGDLAAALADFNRATALNPDSAWIIADRGVTYALMGKYEQALADFDRAIKLDPDFAWAVAHRGLTYRRMERYEQALADFDRAIDLNPDYTWATARRAETYRLMERYEEALADFDRAIELDPDNDCYLYQRALTRQALGQTDRAQQDLAAAIGRAHEAYGENPEDWINTLNLALYHVAAGESKEAEHLYREAISNGASSHRIREAIRDLEDFLALFPDHSQAIAMRDMLQQCLEEIDE